MMGMIDDCFVIADLRLPIADCFVIADLRLPIADCYTPQSAISENSELLYESNLYGDGPPRLVPLLYSGGVEPTARGRAG